MKRIARVLYDEIFPLGMAAQDDFGRYRDDPVGFAADVLNLRVSKRQAEVLVAMSLDDKVTVRSGRRVGKSTLAAVCALWFWATRERARVILTAPKFTQIQEIVWNEIRLLYNNAKKPLGGKLALLAQTGLRSEDGRQIFGVTADKAEAFQGLAGWNLLFIADEASMVGEHIYVALMGNLAGGGKLLLIGNPTQSQGFFWESHKSPEFIHFHISSLESPNITGEFRQNGLATLEWVEQMGRMWGKESAYFRIHVLGEFVEQQEGRLFSPSLIANAESIWGDTGATGPLIIGLDPAGEGSDGDESAFVCRRGQKVVWMHTRRGLSPDGHVTEILGLIATHRAGSWETPRIIVDRDGPVGAKVYGALLGHLETPAGKDAYHVVGVRGSEAAKRRPNEINHVRDEMWFALVDALKAGLAIPVSAQLQGDLAAIRFDRLVSGRATVIKKNIIRKELGRSPDLGDALALAAYDGPAWVETQAREMGLGPTGRVGASEIRRNPRRGPSGFDPYNTGGDDDGGGFDPYA